jgi:hypothetical protein
MLTRVDQDKGRASVKPAEVMTRKPSFWISNMIVLAILGAIMYFFAPRTLSWLLYQIIYGHFMYVLVVIVAAIMALIAFGLYAEDRRKHLAVLYGTLAFFVLAGGGFVEWSGTSSVLAQNNIFAKRTALLDDSKSHVRFTPFSIAAVDMRYTFSDSAYYLDTADVAAVEVDDAFGYVVPIVPNGFFQTWISKMSGFVIFNDDPNVPDEKRIRRVHQEFATGIGMQWFDDIWLQLARHDLFAVYGKPYYEQLDLKNRDKFTIVVPKMSYHFGMAAYIVPVMYLDWAGVALVHDDGTIENLSIAQAKADARLKGHMIYPYELSYKVIHAQTYDEGLLSGWINRSGKIDIPTLPGDNQMPYLIKGADGHNYDVVTAEPAGPSHSIFRVYSIDMFSGERSVFEFDRDKQGLLGPAAAISNGSSISGINWIHETKDGEVGNFRLIEPIPVTRDGKLYWKMTMTQRAYSNVASTIVVNPAKTSDNTLKFDSRADFMAWLNGHETVQPSAATSATATDLVQMRELYRKAKESLDALGAALNNPK